MPARHHDHHDHHDMGQTFEKAARTVTDTAKDLSDDFHRLTRPGEAGKCPRCGQLLDAEILVCPACGHERKKLAVPENITTFVKEINDLEKKRQAMEDMAYTSFSVRTDGDIDENALTIRREEKDEALTLFLCGRLDTTTAPLLEAELQTSLGGVKNLLMDLAELEYLSSAGLRVFLSTQKIMNKQGSMKIVHANEVVMEAFQIAEFTDFMTIE